MEVKTVFVFDGLRAGHDEALHRNAMFDVLVIEVGLTYSCSCMSAINSTDTIDADVHL